MYHPEIVNMDAHTVSRKVRTTPAGGKKEDRIENVVTLDFNGVSEEQERELASRTVYIALQAEWKANEMPEDGADVEILVTDLMQDKEKEILTPVERAKRNVRKLSKAEKMEIAREMGFEFSETE